MSLSDVVRVLHDRLAQVDAAGHSLPESREAAGGVEELERVQRRVELPGRIEHESVRQVSSVVNALFRTAD